MVQGNYGPPFYRPAFHKDCDGRLVVGTIQLACDKCDRFWTIKGFMNLLDADLADRFYVLEADGSDFLSYVLVYKTEGKDRFTALVPLLEAERDRLERVSF